MLLVAMLGSCDRARNPGTGTAPPDPSADIPLLGTWPREGPPLRWKFEGLGKGYGSPLISKEGIFVNAEENGNSYTVCLDHQGNLRWRSPNGTEFSGSDFTASYPGTRSTPTLAGGLVYAASGTGHLSCFDSRDGRIIWAVDLVKDFNGKPGDFGFSESPVVDAVKVYCFAGGRENNIVALDRGTGEPVWISSANRDSFAYGTSVLISLPERNVLAGSSRNFIHVVDREDGTLLSSYRLEDIKYGYEHCNSVVYHDGSLYFIPSEEDGQGTVRLLISNDGTALTEKWRNREVINVFEGFVVKDRWLYTTLENKKLVSLDTETGDIVHSVRAVSGTIVSADRRLIIYGHNGVVQLFTLEDGKPVFRSQFRIREGSGQHFSFPVIAAGMMYIRRGNVLMAFDVSR
jgi:outer membrane protein assembly factor BamB